jgi:hypothetical protein
MQHQGSLEYEFIAMPGTGQSVEEPLHRVVLEKFVEQSPAFSGFIKQALMHRGFHVIYQPFFHRMLSR